MNWKALDNISQIDEILERSKVVPCAILKHSTTCSISAMAKYRLEDDWDFEPTALEPYLLDLLSHRAISNQLAEVFQVHHESPQVLLIVNGECIFDTSHLDISVSELQEALVVEGKF
jgi:bacillithiol system protein YtxJ